MACIVYLTNVFCISVSRMLRRHYVAVFNENAKLLADFTNLEVNTILQLSDICPSDSLLVLQCNHYSYTAETALRLIDRVKVLCPTRHKIGHFGDAHPSRSLG